MCMSLKKMMLVMLQISNFLKRKICPESFRKQTLYLEQTSKLWKTAKNIYSVYNITFYLINCIKYSYSMKTKFNNFHRTIIFRTALITKICKVSLNIDTCKCYHIVIRLWNTHWNCYYINWIWSLGYIYVTSVFGHLRTF